MTTMTAPNNHSTTSLKDKMTTLTASIVTLQASNPALALQVGAHVQHKHSCRLKDYLASRDVSPESKEKLIDELTDILDREAFHELQGTVPAGQTGAPPVILPVREQPAKPVAPAKTAADLLAPEDKEDKAPPPAPAPEVAPEPPAPEASTPPCPDPDDDVPPFDPDDPLGQIEQLVAELRRRRAQPAGLDPAIVEQVKEHLTTAFNSAKLTVKKIEEAHDLLG